MTTPEQIARDAGFRQCHGNPNEWWTYTDSIERFAILACADLVAENETLRNEATAWHVSYDNLKADAERYRWMRDKTFTSDWNVLAYKAVDYVDSYIDAAMKGTPQ
jgi:hypothetical protein